MTTNLKPGSTTPLFQENTAELFDIPEKGEGLFVVGQEDTTNIFLFEDNTNNIVTGGNEADTIITENGFDNINGAKGDDFLFSGEGDDLLRGGEGDDLLIGGEGDDLLIGGKGSDIFEFFANQFTPGKTDVIIDFGIGDDSLVIIGSTDISYESSSGLLSVNGSEVVSLQAGLDLNIVTGETSSVAFSGRDV
jgi:Ca2+-binding RTX toxin-like protein